MSERSRFIHAIAYIIKHSPQVVVVNLLNVIVALSGVAVRLSLIAKAFGQYETVTVVCFLQLAVLLVVLDLLSDVLQFVIRRQCDKSDDRILTGIIKQTYEQTYNYADKENIYAKNQDLVFNLAYIGGYANIIGSFFNVLSGCCMLAYFTIVLGQLLYELSSRNLSVVIICIIILVVSFWLLRKTKFEKADLMKDILAYEKKRNYYIYNLINNYPLHSVFKPYNFMGYIDEKYRQINDQAKAFNISYTEQINASHFRAIIINIICISIMFGVAILNIFYGLNQLSMLPFYVSLSIQVATSNTEIAQAISNIQRKKPYMVNLFSIVQKMPEEQTEWKAKNIETINTIEFKNVSFSYQNVDNYVFHDLSFVIDFSQKKKTVIVGANGSGKTTMIKLILGLIKPDSGQILINGKDLSFYDNREWATNFNVLMQEYSLFDGTIEDNIALDKEIDEKRMMQSIIKADGQELINKHSRSTRVESLDKENVTLSGGERQKVAMARMAYKKGDTYVMDEPTAAFDAISESKFFSSLDKNYNSDRVICITHRVMNCQYFDYVYVLKNGQLEQQGTFAELKDCGYFGELVRNELKSLKGAESVD